jgi:CBS domain-containing protein
MSVKDLMTEQPRTVGPYDKLDAAARRMWEGDCGALPVVNDEGVVISMITDRDICMATWSRNQRPEELRVRDAMSQRLVTCSPSEPLDAAEAAMRLHQVRRLPVVDEGKKLVGIISLADIALANERAARQDRARESDGLSTTLAIICEKTPIQASSTDEPPATESQQSTSSMSRQPKEAGGGKAA